MEIKIIMMTKIIDIVIMDNISLTMIMMEYNSWNSNVRGESLWKIMKTNHNNS